MNKDLLNIRISKKAGLKSFIKIQPFLMFVHVIIIYRRNILSIKKNSQGFINLVIIFFRRNILY